MFIQHTRVFRLQKQAIRLIFNARKRVHTSRLFALANIMPITRIYEAECIKLVFKNKFDPSIDDQPIGIRELIDLPDSNNDRLYENQFKNHLDTKSGILYKNYLKLYIDMYYANGRRATPPY